MRNFPSLLWLLPLELLLALLCACRTFTPPARLLDLQGRAPNFRALYRLECCGLRGLLLAVQHGEGWVSLETAGGPAGALRAFWLADGQILERSPRGCLVRWPETGIPLVGKAVFPMALEVFVPLLVGLLPPGGHEMAPEVWGLEGAGFSLTLQLAGGPSRWVKGRWVMDGTQYAFWASQHRGRVPGNLVVRGPHLNLEMVLLEFRPVVSLTSPPWVSWALCPEAS